jgi:hypothetical protein
MNSQCAERSTTFGLIVAGILKMERFGCLETIPPSPDSEVISVKVIYKYMVIAMIEMIPKYV